MSKTFNDLSIADLVLAHNSKAGTKPVKSFRTKADGQKRVLAHMTEAEALERVLGIDGVEVETPDEDLMDLPLTDPRHPLHVSEADRKESWAKNPPKAAPFVAVAPTLVAPSKTRKRRKDVEAMVVVVLASENPHREKSAAGQRFTLYQSGQTVEEFVAAWASLGHGRLDKKRARRARRQVRKDSAKGHIKLVTRGEWLKSQEQAAA